MAKRTPKRKRDAAADPAVIDLAQQREQRRKHQPSGDAQRTGREDGGREDASPTSRGEKRGEKQIDARGRRVRPDEVDEASDDSFPASDPPSFTGGR